MRKSEINRKTNETDIALTLCLDGTGKSNINTGVGFLDHMLTLFAKHSKFDLDITCNGDTEVDAHHTTEDIGIALGLAFDKAIGEKVGITRFASETIPMDEALILCAVDISGRSFLGYGLDIPSFKVGDFDTELVEEFYRAFTQNAKLNLHLKQFYGTNSHHIIEGAFKAAGRTLRQAVKIDADFSNDIPSTKGVL